MLILNLEWHIIKLSYSKVLGNDISYAKGNASQSSYIDLYIDTNGRLKGLDFVGFLETLSNSLGIEIDLIDRSHIEPDSSINQEIENGGTVIYEKPEE